MPKVCEVHNVELLTGKLEIRRGMPPAPPLGFFEAEKELFPYANSFEIGGCVIPDDAKSTRRTRFCAACRVAKSEWESGREVEEFWLG